MTRDEVNAAIHVWLLANPPARRPDARECLFCGEVTPGEAAPPMPASEVIGVLHARCVSGMEATRRADALLALGIEDPDIEEAAA